MDREILFRGKRLDNGEWVEGSYMEHYYSSRFGRVSAIFTNDDVLCKTYRIPVDPSTVGQYTGLTDKNGKKIFEGDILERRLLPAKRICTRSVVKFTPAHAAFAINDIGCGSIIEDYLDSITRMNYEIGVIGSAHDNPELMRGEDDG